MALDRTWYNTLVDDDGSGLTGSVWDKADVDALMDDIDDEIARLDSNILAAGSSANTFTPTLVGSGGGTPTYTIQLARYVRNGTQIGVMGRIALSSKGSLAGSLSIGGFPYAASAHTHQCGIQIGYYAGLAVNAASMSSYINPSATQAQLMIMGAAGGVANAVVDITYVTNGFDFIFGGSYQID